MRERNKTTALVRSAWGSLGLAVMLAGLLPPTGWAASKGPDASNYTATDATVYSFVDISGPSGGSSVLSGTDDGMAALTLPFTFTFYGQGYSVVCASTNGVLYFVAGAGACATLPNDFANTDISVSGAPDGTPAIMPFWTDLTFQVPGAGAVYYQTLGTTGSRRFIIQWNNAYPQGSTSPVTFQLILGEGANSIAFQYQTVNLGSGNPANNGAQATVGIANNTPVTSNQQIEWSYDVPVFSNAYALAFGASAQITLSTVPTGLLVSVDGGTAQKAPFTASLAAGPHAISVNQLQGIGTNTLNVFSNWSDGLAAAHSITVTNTSATYTATFQTQYKLTTASSPSAGGSISPASGTYFSDGSGISVQATANAGYQFANFSGTVIATTNPLSLTMNRPHSIVANFTPVAPNLAATVGARSDVVAGSTRQVTLMLTNTGIGAAANATITSITAIADVAGSGAVSVASGTPVDFGTINQGSSATTTAIIFNWPMTATRVRFTVNFTADGGYSGSSTITTLR
jgi:hypothetical protein